MCFLCLLKTSDAESGNCVISPNALFFAEQTIPVFCPLWWDCRWWGLNHFRPAQLRSMGDSLPPPGG